MTGYDFLLVGAGPIGIECAVHLKRHGARYRHLEAGQIGATIGWYAPGTHFFSSPERLSIAGVPLRTVGQTKPTREEYLNYLRAVVEQFELAIDLYTLVTSIERNAEGFTATYARHPDPGARTPAATLEWSGIRESETLRARRVILAIGDMHRPNLLGIPGEDLPHVSHYLEEPHRYFRRRVVIVGGKNSAVEAAIRLYRAGCSVTMAYRASELDRRRIKYWLYPELLSLASTGAITLLGESDPVGISLEAVRLRRRSGEERTVPADHVLLLTGYAQDNALFRQLGLELEGGNECPVLDSQTRESTVPGVYVIGTGSAGTQRSGVKEFIETSHAHVAGLMRHLFGDELETRAVDPESLES